MNDQKKPGRIALSIVYSVLVFLILAVTMLIVAVVFVVLVQLGVFENILMLSMSNMILLLALTSVVIGTIITVVTRNIPLHPINNIINTMNTLASGDYSARIRLGKFPVAKELEDSINTMAQELEHTEKLRSDFINNFSHEFKTPIVSIAGFANLLRTEDIPEDKQKEYLEVIEDEAHRLAKMATDVLNLTKIENQIILTNVTDFNLSEQLRTCVLMLEDKWLKKELDIEILFDEYTVNGNEELLKQVWINIIDNAIKFTPEGGMLKISASQTDTETKVSVFNTGSYIRKEDYVRIFSKFYQADTSHSGEGNGIGLATVKTIIQLHKGKIDVNSDDSGTEFVVTLYN